MFERRGARWRVPPTLAAWVLALVQAVLYLRGLHPGVADGDAAELQWAAPLLGIAHSPGYALQITAGRLFLLLPLGGDAAWRMNLMSATCGVLGGLALFCAVRRITGHTLPGLVAQAMLGFGTVWWSQSLIAEVYVFGGALLCAAIAAAARFVTAGRAVWLAISALLLGMVVAERPSELLIVPAFAGLLLAFQHRTPMTQRRWLLAAGCLAAPFAVAAALNVMRAHPERLAVRDDALRDGIVGHREGEVTLDYTRTQDKFAALRATVPFMLGMPWIARLPLIDGAGEGAGGPEGGFREAAAKCARLLAGGLVPTGATDPLLKGGISPGPLGLLLALLGAYLWRREIGWVALGAGLFAGNTLFILVYEAWDSLTFAVPGQIGLALMAGLGSAGPPEAPMRRHARIGLGVACLVAALALVPVNAPWVGRDTPAERRNQALMDRVAREPLPDRAVILTKYWPAMTLRYLFWIRADRADVSVIHAMRGTHLELAAALHAQGREIFVTGDVLPPEIEKEVIARTPTSLRSLGLLSMGDLAVLPVEPSP